MAMRFYGPRRRLTAEEKAANAARKVADAATARHCQICDRLIQANTGLIAHHGYQRPSQGWQTASCMGARYRPYEVACDALPPAITAVTNHIDRMEKALAEWQANPPQAIQCERARTNRYDAWDKYSVTWSVLKPADFDKAAPLPREKNQAEWDSHPQPRSNYGVRECDAVNYAHMYASRVAEIIANIKDSRETLAYFTKRLADWKPQTEEPKA
jgi:hypothetical protein